MKGLRVFPAGRCSCRLQPRPQQRLRVTKVFVSPPPKVRREGVFCTHVRLLNRLRWEEETDENMINKIIIYKKKTLNSRCECLSAASRPGGELKIPPTSGGQDFSGITCGGVQLFTHFAQAGRQEIPPLPWRRQAPASEWRQSSSRIIYFFFFSPPSIFCTYSHANPMKAFSFESCYELRSGTGYDRDFGASISPFLVNNKSLSCTSDRFPAVTAAFTDVSAW